MVMQLHDEVILEVSVTRKCYAREGILRNVSDYPFVSTGKRVYTVLCFATGTIQDGTRCCTEGTPRCQAQNWTTLVERHSFRFSVIDDVFSIDKTWTSGSSIVLDLNSWIFS